MTAITHNGRKRKIFLQPSDMVLYESATVPHGRQFPLNGEYYDNIFVHFYPKLIEWKESFAEFQMNFSIQMTLFLKMENIKILNLVQLNCKLWPIKSTDSKLNIGSQNDKRGAKIQSFIEN